MSALDDLVEMAQRLFDALGDDLESPYANAFDAVRKVRAERDDLRQRHANQVRANEEDWTVFKLIAGALGMDSFRLVDLAPKVAAYRAIVRDLAAKRPPAYNGTCLLCYFVDEDEVKVNHSADCPYRRAVELCV